MLTCATGFIAGRFTRGFTARYPRPPRGRGHLTQCLWHRHVDPHSFSFGPSPQRPAPSQADQPGLFDGELLLVAVDRIDEEPNNPRTEFPDAQIDELADDIRQRGVLQPVVVHAADSNRGELSDLSLKAVCRRMGANCVPHGFRSTFRDWCAENTNVAREVAEMALAHTVGNEVEAAYRRGDLFQKRRVLMTDWAAFCEGNNSTGGLSVST